MRLYSLPGLARSESSLRRTNRFRPGAEQLDDRLVPAGLDPVYMATFGDAVTDDNAFSASGYRQWTIDAGADVYQTDTYERPVAQTFKVVRDASGTQQFAASEYFQNLDIVQARAGFDDTFLYVAVKVAGLSKLTDDGKVTPEGLAYRYGFRIATQADGGGGLLVTADQPQFKNSPNTTFGQVGTFVYRDANGDVGGTGRDVTKQDRQAEVGGNGYERVAASDGRLSNGQSVLFIRVNPNDPTEVEFALKYQSFGYSAADLQNLPYFVAEANKGLKDPGNYSWNDEYKKSEAGSPYRAAFGDLSKSEFGTQGLGNIYELDTTDLGPLFQPEGASIGGSVYLDFNNSGTFDAGELGIAGVTITLTGTDVLGQAVSRTAVTDESGNYLFSDLLAGTYELHEEQPLEFTDGIDTVGSVNGETRGIESNNDLFANITLSEGEGGVDYLFAEKFE